MLFFTIKRRSIAEHTYKSAIGSNRRIEISFADRWFLILYSGRFFAVLNNSYKSAGTLALLLHKLYGKIV